MAAWNEPDEILLRRCSLSPEHCVAVCRRALENWGKALLEPGASMDRIYEFADGEIRWIGIPGAILAWKEALDYWEAKAKGDDEAR